MLNLLYFMWFLCYNFEKDDYLQNLMEKEQKK